MRPEKLKALCEKNVHILQYGGKLLWQFLRH